MSSVDPERMIVSWEEPTDINGNLENYKVTCYEKTTTFVSSVDTDNTTVTMDGLQACVMYTFVVQAKTGAGFGSVETKEGTTFTGGIGVFRA